MSDIEKAKRQLDICGYSHPKNTKSSKNKKYMTFDTENTEKKSYDSFKNYSGYAKFTDKESLKKLDMSCPECGETALYVCNCKYKDKQCEKGHIWYINSKKQIFKGDPHN